MTSAHQRVKIPFADPALQADIDTHADQFGALFRQSVYLPGGHEHGIPCFPGKNGGGDYGGNPNGNNRHAKRFLRDLKPVVSHAGTGHDTGGGKLNGGAEALCACGGKRVHRNDARRLYNGRYTLYDLRAFYAGFAKHARAYAGDGFQIFQPHFFFEFSGEMAGRENIRTGFWAERVCRYIHITKTDHKNIVTIRGQKIF